MLYKFIDFPIKYKDSLETWYYIASILGVIFLFITLIVSYKSFKNSTTQLQEQRNQFSRQNFDNKFFKLLELHTHSLNNLVYKEKLPYDGDKPLYKVSYKEIKHEYYTGVKAFEKCLTDFEIEYSETLEKYKRQIPKKTHELISEEAFQLIFIRYSMYFEKYMLNFKYIINSIINSELLNEKDKKEYLNLYRVQLSMYEVSFLNICFRYSQKEDNFKQTLENYKFFHMNT